MEQIHTCNCRLKKFNRICRDIKSVKIQGAENVAKAGLHAFSLVPSKESIKKLSGLRPTEPMLFNSLALAEKYGSEMVLRYISQADDEIAVEGAKLVKKNSIIFTHCHSSRVINILKMAKKNGKKFQVFNTETRPLLQGRKTAEELAKARIPVTTFVDSFAALALTKNRLFKKSNFMLIGADALLVDEKNRFAGALNKVGSGMFAELAHDHKIPVYIASDSLKLTRKPIKIEKRPQKEVWNERSRYIKTLNYAFEKVEPRYVTRIICEFGILTPSQLIRKAEKTWDF